MIKWLQVCACGRFGDNEQATVLNCTEDYGRRLLPLCPHL